MTSIALPDLSHLHAIITGANSGVGKETARALAKAGAKLVLACRSAAKAEPVVAELKAESGTEHIEFMPLDLADFDSVRAFAAAWLARGEPLNLLVNNAGLAGQQGLSKSGFEVHFGVNHLGPFLLTELLLDRIKESAPARIVNVSSKAHTNVKAIPWEALTQPTKTKVGMAEYGVSKLANALHARELARRLEGSGVVTASLHPGVVASDVWREVPGPIAWLMKLFMISNEEGAQTTLTCSVSDEVLAHSGAYWDGSKRKEPSPLAQDDAVADELRRRSLTWVGLSE